MRHFKLPLIVTAVTLLVGILLGLGLVTWIYKSKVSNREKQARAEMLGGGVALGTCLIIAPFWLVAAARMGKERRAARGAAAAGQGGS